jgi:hypothetical protein
MWRKVLAFLALVPGLALAADDGLMELVMPDARLVMEIKLAKLSQSPVGQMVKAEMEKARPQLQQRMIDVAGFALTQYVQDIVIAGSGNEPRMLVLVRGTLDLERMGALEAFSGGVTKYRGVSILSSSGKGKGAIAFLDGGKIAILGKLADVKAAIGQRGHGVGLSPVLAAEVKQYDGQYDAWVVSAGPLVPASKLSAAPGVPAAARKFLESLEAFRGGLRLSRDFDASVEMVARSETEAAQMAQSMRWFLAAARSQQEGASGLENLKFELKGRRIRMSLRVPEGKIRLALQQAGVHEAVRSSQAIAPAPAGDARAEADYGVPPPPHGTIRILSSPSDMGTVLLPAGK